MMPTYEYECHSCGKIWDEEQSIVSTPSESCPYCHQPNAHRLISGGTGFLLKGGGWYSSGYASTPAKDPPAGDGS